MTIPSYGLLITLAWLFSGALVLWRAKKNNLDTNDAIIFIVYIAVFGFIGAKLLYILTILPQIASSQIAFDSIMDGGFVFYGGVLGGVAGIPVCCKLHNIRLREVLWVVWVLPLAHAVGRVGCFMAGCCYGMESHALGIAFSNSPVAPNGVSLLPVQLIEAFVEACIFVVLSCMLKRKKDAHSMILAYIYTYCPFRFIIEFFRSDAERGIVAGLSTSQWISVFLIIGALIFQFYIQKLKNETTG